MTNVTAVRLLADPRIKALVDEGKAKLSEQTGLKNEWFVGQVKTSFEQAVADKHHTAVGRLGELLARLHGWTLENRNLRVIRSIEDLTDSELHALIGEQGRQ